MFKDQREELRRLEAELLLEEEEEAMSSDEEAEWEEEWEEEEWEESEESEEPDFPVYNSDRLDGDLEDFGFQNREDPGRVRGKWMAAVLLVVLAALLLTLAFFLARFMGR